MKFRAKIELGGKTATGFEVPAKVVEALESGKKPAVVVKIHGYTYRSTVATMGGRYMVGVSAQVREAAGVQAGEVVDVDLQLDTAPREVEVPTDLKQALAKDKQAKSFFESLSYSYKRRIVLSIDDAKTAETRQRRIDRSITNLHAGKA